MIDFWKDLFSMGFLQRALIAVFLSAPAAGMIGSLVHVRKLGALAGAMAHASLGGMGFAVWMNSKFDWELSPLWGGLLATLIASFLLGALKTFGNQKEESLLNAMWSIGMSIGLLFLAMTPGYSEDLESWLFGNLLIIRSFDLWLLAGLNVLISIFCYSKYRQLEATSFDEEYAWLRGVRTFPLYLVLLIMTGFTLILLMQLVGIVMVIALMALPTATMAPRVKSLQQLMIWSSVLCLLYGIVGLNVSYALDLPAGPMIVLMAGLAYAASIAKEIYKTKRKRAF